MTAADTVARARGACGHGCDYKLGAGGMRPNDPQPWDEREGRKECDCSGFAMWAWGMSRLQKPGGRDLWYDTSQIARDARYSGQLFELLDSWESLRPGDGLVWGDRHGKQGHVGIVVATEPLAVAHCSRGNWTRTKDAIQETPSAIFADNGALAVRCKKLEPVGAGETGV